MESISPEQTAALSTLTSPIGSVRRLDLGSPSIAKCWQNGVEIHNRGHSSNDKKRIDNGSPENHSICTFDAFHKAVIDAKEKCDSSRGKFQRKLEEFLDWIEPYSPVADVLIQQQPNITSIVWGGLRFLIRIAAQKSGIEGAIEEGIVIILINIGTWHQNILNDPHGESTIEASSHLFGSVLSFVIESRLHYENSETARVWAASFTKLPAAIRGILYEIKSRSDDQHRAVSSAETARNSQFRNTQIHYLTLQEIMNTEQRVFREETRETYQQLQDTLEEMGRVTLENTHLDKVQRAIELLETETHVLLVPEAAEGTCEWIFQHQNFLKWIHEQCRQTLWIGGAPGCGKSVLANFLRQHTTPQQITLTHFFQASRSKGSTNARSLGISIINQLLKKELAFPRPEHREVFDDLASFCLEIGYASQITFHRLQHIAKKTLLAISQYTLIIDGLDECSNIADISEFIEALLGSESRVLPYPKIVLLSREHDGLKTLKENSIAIAMDQITMNPMIHHFISTKANEHPQLQRIQQDIYNKAQESCHGSFLWASTMIECLVQPVRSEWEQLQRLKRIPAGIIDFFEDLVNRSGRKRSKSDLKLRREMFLILLNPQKSLTLDEFAIFLQFRHSRRQEKARRLQDIRNAVLDLCWPLVSVMDGYVALYHMNVAEFLVTEEKNCVEEGLSVHISLEKSNATLASRCLHVLSEEQNRSPGRIAYWLYKNIYPEYSVNAANVESQDEALSDIVLYEYAARYWAYHLTAVSKPSKELLIQLDSFLRNFQFVKWAEYIYNLKGENTSFSELYGDLKSWWALLPPDSQGCVSMESFFTVPYRSLSVHYAEENQDKLLEYLCLFRLGDYYTLQIEIDAAYEVKREVVNGLESLLGSRNPLTLRAKTALGMCHSANHEFRRALDLYREISAAQKEVLGLERQDYWSTLRRIAFVQFLMANFGEAATTMAEISAGWKSRPGLPTRFLILSNNLIEGYIYEARELLGEAMNLYRVVWNDQTEIFGENNPMALYAQIGMGSIYRKQKDYGAAIRNLDHAFQIRTQLWGLDNGWVIDPAIQLIISFREKGEFDQAMARIELLSQCELLKRDFERKCQVKHLEALLLYDEEELEEQRLNSDGAVLVGHKRFGKSQRILRGLLHEQNEKGRDANNRSLLWVRLTLASLLRENQQDDDVAPLFDEIVQAVRDGVASPQFEYIESPQEWEIAENALRLVRDRKKDEADRLLGEKGLRWVRTDDFWLFEGGPGVDTAWMKGP